MSLWYVGALLSIFGSVASNLGVNVQKYSFMENAKLSIDKRKTYIRDPRWLLGLLMIMLGSVGDFAALGLAAQSIVAPIGSTTLVANIFFAHYWLRERLTRRDIVGTSLILAGSTLSVSFGDHTETDWNIDELIGLYGNALFILYGVVIFVSAVCLYAAIRRIEPLKVTLTDLLSKYEEFIRANQMEEANRTDSLIVKLERKYQKYERAHPILYCALSGILGAQSILFGKVVAELIATSIRGDNQMVNPLTYLFMLLMFSCVFSQIHFLAKALNFFDALYVVPVFQCFLISVSTFGGASYFQEFSSFSVLQAVLFPIGIVITLSGVQVLSSRKMGNFINGKIRKGQKRVRSSSGSDSPSSLPTSPALNGNGTPNIAINLEPLGLSAWQKTGKSRSPKGKTNGKSLNGMSVGSRGEYTESLLGDDHHEEDLEEDKNESVIPLHHVANGGESKELHEFSPPKHHPHSDHSPPSLSFVPKSKAVRRLSQTHSQNGTTTPPTAAVSPAADGEEVLSPVDDDEEAESVYSNDHSIGPTTIAQSPIFAPIVGAPRTIPLDQLVDMLKEEGDESTV